MKKKLIATAVLGLVAGFAIGYNVGNNTAKPEKIHTFHCIDTALQETVFIQDLVKDVANDYDQWLLQLDDRLVAYVQPSGVFCIIRDSDSFDDVDE